MNKFVSGLNYAMMGVLAIVVMGCAMAPSKAQLASVIDRCGAGANEFVQSDKRTGQYYGEWGGAGGVLPAVLIISKVDGSQVDGYYAHGAQPAWGISSGRCTSFSRAVLAGDTLTINLSGARMVYKIGDAKLSGTHFSANGSAGYANFAKVN